MHPWSDCIKRCPAAVIPAPLIVQQAAKPEEIDDDRESVLPGDPVVLIVEDDPHFGQDPVGSGAGHKASKEWSPPTARHARVLTREFNPRAIMLDIFLPDMLGWTVLNHLKQDPATRHIPVQVISVEEERMQGLGTWRVLLSDQARYDRRVEKGVRPGSGLRAISPDAAC